MTSPDHSPSEFARRLRDGLERVAAALRADGWAARGKTSLNPTQAQILRFLAGQGDKGARVNAVAAHLSVSQPTATDSIAALEKKGLACRRVDPGDRRASTVAPTASGRALAEDIAAAPSATARALDQLSAKDQADLLGLLEKIIRGLQAEGAIDPQRMCATCRYFTPRAHGDPRAPHHCGFTNSAFGPEALRLDCGEHEAAPPQDQERAWKIFAGADGVALP